MSSVWRDEVRPASSEVVLSGKCRKLAQEHVSKQLCSHDWLKGCCNKNMYLYAHSLPGWETDSRRVLT